MEAIPEVREAAERLAAVADETLDLVQRLEAVSALALTLLPSCVGVSLTVLVDGDPFTVTATPADIAGLDAIQYLDGGPCVEAAASAEVQVVDDVLDEPRWQMYSQAAAAVGVRSSMSLPIPRSGDVPAAALNLYASDPHAFHGVHAQLAAMFGAHVSELVENADLSFMTREFARELPQRLEDHEQLNQAVDVLTALRGGDAEATRERIRFAASRAGITPSQVSAIILIVGT
ncbi:MAG: antitermination regulator [Frankiales bacterium]|jgi:GAF domain-containing protein|nr:antitermination regulator [Frankiales bacterium]